MEWLARGPVQRLTRSHLIASHGSIALLSGKRLTILVVGAIGMIGEHVVRCHTGGGIVIDIPTIAQSAMVRVGAVDRVATMIADVVVTEDDEGLLILADVRYGCCGDDDDWSRDLCCKG